MMKKAFITERATILVMVIVGIGALAFLLFNMGITPQNSGITGLAAANLPPAYTGESAKFVIKQNAPVSLNLAELFKDPEGIPLIFDATQTENMEVVLEGNELRIIPEPGFTGQRVVTLYASDGEQVAPA